MQLKMLILKQLLQPAPQRNFKNLSFSPSSYSQNMRWGRGWQLPSITQVLRQKSTKSTIERKQ